MTNGDFPADTIDPRAPHHFYLGAILAWYAFMFLWPTYPVTGAITTLVGVAIVLDDVVSHATGWPTPLDFVWNKWVRDRVP